MIGGIDARNALERVLDDPTLVPKQKALVYYVSHRPLSVSEKWFSRVLAVPMTTLRRWRETLEQLRLVHTEARAYDLESKVKVCDRIVRWGLHPDLLADLGWHSDWNTVSKEFVVPRGEMLERNNTWKLKEVVTSFYPTVPKEWMESFMLHARIKGVKLRLELVEAERWIKEYLEVHEKIEKWEGPPVSNGIFTERCRSAVLQHIARALPFERKVVAREENKVASWVEGANSRRAEELDAVAWAKDVGDEVTRSWLDSAFRSGDIPAFLRRRYLCEGDLPVRALFEAHRRYIKINERGDF